MCMIVYIDLHRGKDIFHAKTLWLLTCFCTSDSLCILNSQVKGNPRNENVLYEPCGILQRSFADTNINNFFKKRTQPHWVCNNFG